MQNRELEKNIKEKKYRNSLNYLFEQNSWDTVYIVNTFEDGTCVFKQWKLANLGATKKLDKIKLDYIPKGLYDNELVYFKNGLFHIDDTEIAEQTRICQDELKRINDLALTKDIGKEDIEILIKEKEDLINLFSNLKYLEEDEDKQYILRKKELIQKEYEKISKKKTKMKQYLKQF